MEKKEKSMKIENMEKEERIFLFMKEIDKNMSYGEIENLYLNKYKLNDRSSKINKNVILRFLGVDSKYSLEEIKENKKVVSEKLREVNIDYNNFMEKVKLLNRNGENRLKINRIENYNFKEL